MSDYPKTVEYKFKDDEVFARHKYDGNVYILYTTVRPSLAETLVASGIEKVFVYVRNICLSYLHSDKKYDHFFYHVVKIEVCPELNYVKVYCLED